MPNEHDEIDILSKRSQKLSWLVRIFTIAGFCGIFGTYPLMAILVATNTLSESTMPYAGCLFLFGLLSLCTGAVAETRHIAMLNEAMANADKSRLGVFLNLYNYYARYENGNNGLRLRSSGKRRARMDAIASCIVRVIADIRPDDRVLTRTQRQELRDMLNSADTTLIRAVLRCLVKIGDDLDLRAIESLSADESRNVQLYYLADDIDAASAAISERLAKSAAVSSLVRASIAPRAEEVQLLRPTTEKFTAPADELLRAEVGERLW